MKQELPKKLLIIYSVNKKFLKEVEESLCLKNFKIEALNVSTDVIRHFDEKSADIVFIDIENLPSLEMDLVNYIKSKSPKTEIIVLTTINEIEQATYSLRYGASFYLIKPTTCSDMKRVIEKLSARISRGEEYMKFEHRVLSDLMAGNSAMQKILKLSMKIAPTTSAVCLTGESGTGKEFFAKIIHRMSHRAEGKFIAINCGAIPDTLFESEMFGHRKGSFTGSVSDKIGLVEEAHMGTLFLDEIGELSPNAQVKLLRFLQEKTYRRIGETIIRTVNVRIITATNRDLLTMVKEGTFREDLYYRVNIFILNLPPLRDRKETIPNLIRLFVSRNNSLLNKDINKISKAAEVIIADYDYPGNVRELENILEHAMILADGIQITDKDLPEFMFKNRLRLTSPNKGTLENTYQTEINQENIYTLNEMEKGYIQKVLDILDNNYTMASQKLGISRSTLWRKIKTYNL